MADATTRSLERILASGQYEVEPDVPLFDAHTDYDEKGEPLRVFDEKKLRQIADECNERAKRTGDLSPFGPGHLLYDQKDPKTGMVTYKAKETDQPPVWGFFHNFRVGEFGPEKVKAILADMLVRKDKRDEAMTYPRRSVELWAKSNFIDWVALLRRTPQRDLGVLTHSAGDFKVCYAMEASMPDPTTPPTDKPPAPAAPPAPPAPAAPAAQPAVTPAAVAGPEGVPPEFHQYFKACMQHAAAHPQGYAASPGPTNGAMPAAQPAAPAQPPAPAKPATPPAPAARTEQQMDGEPDLYNRIDARLQEMETRTNARVQQIEAEAKKAREDQQREKLNRLADRLDHAGYCFAKDRFVERCLPLDEKGVEREVNDVITYSKQDPTREYGNPRDAMSFTTDTQGQRSLGVRPPELSQEALDRQLEEARKYERQGMPWIKAMAKAQGILPPEAETA